MQYKYRVPTKISTHLYNKTYLYQHGANTEHQIKGKTPKKLKIIKSNKQQWIMVELVLCIDRDDDIGRKTGLKGPFIGRDANLKAANALALADPEDSDTNALFGAISTYDTLKKDGKDVEVITICGAVPVGTKSDQKIAEQLDQVIEKFNPSSVVLISDGVEDEYIMPIVTSRVHVSHLRRVIVKQSKNLESSFYIFVKALQDEKISKKILIPIALIFLGYSLSIIFISAFTMFFPNFKFPDPSTFAISVITLVLGVYFLMRGFRLGMLIKQFTASLKKSFIEAKMSFVANVIAVLLMLEGLIFSWQQTATTAEIIAKIIIFLKTLSLWVLVAILIREGGLNFDQWFHFHKVPKGFWVGMISAIGVTFVIYGSLDFLSVQLGYKAIQITIASIIIIIIGIILVLFAAVVHKAIKSYFSEDYEEAETDDVS